MNSQRSVVEVPVVELSGKPASAKGALVALFEWGEGLVGRMREVAASSGVSCAMGRIRGLGAGASFSGLLEVANAEYPLEQERPFEGVEAIAGAAWVAGELGIAGHRSAWLRLEFDGGTTDLPLHSHDKSDRLIVVLGGRGLFHWQVEGSRDVRTIVVRKRDVLAFGAGVYHTFSTGAESLHLFSYHSPFVPLDSREQYTVGEPQWRPVGVVGREAIGCDAAWSVLSRST